MRWTAAEERFLLENANALSSRDIGVALSRSPRVVRSKAGRLKISLSGWHSGKYRKYSLNERFFENLSALSAYWLGVLWADAHLSRYGVVLSISQRDAEWLQLYIADLDSDAPIAQNRRRGAVIGGLYSTQLVTSLSHYGLKAGDRTRTPSVPRNIPDEYLRDFLRGLFDGDGNFNQRGKYESIVTITNTRAMCDWILHVTRQFLDVGGGVYNRRRCNVSDWKLGGRRQVQLFVKWIYTGAVRYLPRKRNKFINYGFQV